MIYSSEIKFYPWWQYYHSAQINNFPNQENELLALVNRCDEKYDFHWEREWRIVGDLEFELNDVYCGLCSEDCIRYFESKFRLKFIDPYWGMNQIIDKLVEKPK